MGPGYLVEFFEEKRLICALVLELKGERLHVFTQTSREMTLAPKRVLHACLSPLNPAAISRQEILNYLEETAKKRETLKAGINLKELWELLSQENQAMTGAEMADLWFGKASPDQVAAMGRALREERFLFRYKDGVSVPNSPETVAQLEEQEQREAARHQELEEAAAWLQAVWEGREIREAPPWRARLVELLRQMAVLGTEAPDYALGKAYLEMARLSPGDAPFRLLVRLGVFSEDEYLDLHRLEVPQEFSAEARSQARHLKGSLPADPYASHRADLTHLECLTIDGEYTRDYDDALSLEELPAGWRLGIHIADVSALVRPDTPLDLEARDRGASIYLPERRLPMLPEEISEDALSLLAQEERRALSFLVTLSPEGEILDWSIVPSLIKVQQRLTYHEVDRLLPGDRKLRALAHLTQRFRDRRLAQGYELKLPEVWVNLTPEGEIQVTVEDQETVSHQTVSEAMVLANWLAARFLVAHNLPAIYRAQPEPREPIRREEPKGLLELWQDRRRLSRVVLDLNPSPHWGLGLDYYTFATSPIRRYLDLVIHRQLLGGLGDGPPPYSREELEKIVSVIDPAMRRATFLKTRRLRYWLLKYLATRLGTKMEALVLETLPNRYRLMLPDLLLEVVLTAPATLRLTPGERLQVRLERVQPQGDQVKVSLA